MLKKFAKRVQMMVGRAILLTIKDDNPIQLVKLNGLENEVPEDVERIQNYGLSSVVPKGGECVVLYVQGNRDDGLVIAADHGTLRIKNLNSGEVVLYSEHGQKLLLNESGEHVFNDGTDYAVAFEDLKSAFDEFKSDFNSHVTRVDTHTHLYSPGPSPQIATAPPATPGTPTAASVDAARVDEIRVP